MKWVLILYVMGFPATEDGIYPNKWQCDRAGKLAAENIDIPYGPLGVKWRCVRKKSKTQ